MPKFRKPHIERIHEILIELYTYGFMCGKWKRGADKDGINRALKEIVEYVKRIKL